MVELISIIGLFGSVTASSLFFPQVYAAWKTKRTKDLSWLTILIGVVNGLLWTYYGLLKADPFIYITNVLLFAATFMLVMLKKRYG
mgnify:FL=1